MNMNHDNTRNKFEEWMKLGCASDPGLETDEYGHYIDRSVYDMFVGFAAAMESFPADVMETLEWYASEPDVWVAWNAEGWAKEDAANASGHYVFIGEDFRGHNQYKPNGVRAENALDTLKEWFGS